MAAFFDHLAKAAQDALRVHPAPAKHLFNLCEVLSDVSKVKHESNYFTKKHSPRSTQRSRRTIRPNSSAASLPPCFKVLVLVLVPISVICVDRGKLFPILIRVIRVQPW